jgi:tetratricopeptide (TPR) repeat protein
MLADRLARRGAFDRARDQIRAAEAIFERLGRPPTDGVALLATKSIVELAAGNLPVAIEAAEGAIAQHDELAWGAPGERAQLLGMLSAALFEQGEHGRATQLQLEALELRRIELGPHHPLVALALANAAVATDTSDPLAARALNAEAIAIFEKHERGHELSLAVCLVHEAASAVEVGELASAAATNARAVELFDRFAHPDDPFAADAVINRARIRLAQGELDDALGDARDALDRFTRTRGASDSSTLGARALLGDVLAARGDAAAARRERCDAHAALVATYGADHPLVPEFARRCPGAD